MSGIPSFHEEFAEFSPFHEEIMILHGKCFLCHLLFQVFSPLPKKLKLEPTTGYKDLHRVALARVLVDNIPSIQIDWRLYGPKLAQVALAFGANDLDRVSPFDTLENGRRRSPLEEIKQNILAASLKPVQRNCRFELTPVNLS